MQLSGFPPPPPSPTSHNPHTHTHTCCQVFALQRQLSDANASSAEIGASSAALMDLVGEGPALQAMLNCYSHKIRLDQSLLLKQHTAGAGGGRGGTHARAHAGLGVGGRRRQRGTSAALGWVRNGSLVWWSACHISSSRIGT
jgi:hypothetical protein